MATKKTNKRLFERDAAIQQIISALKKGRCLSLYDGRTFRVAEMHTCFCDIRKKINDGKIPGYVLCDRWKTNRNGVRYKEYWFEKVQ